MGRGEKKREEKEEEVKRKAMIVFHFLAHPVPLSFSYLLAVSFTWRGV